jgi:hypothetical protein
MNEDLRITGVEQLTILGARLKKAGAGDLRLDLLRGLRAAAKPLIAEAHQAARDQLPKRGGLNERVAKDSITVRNRLSGKQVGVRIVTTKSETRGANRGKIRHPVFGDREKWVTQEYEPAKGWFDDTLRNGAPEVQAEMVKVMQEVAFRLTLRHG